MKDYSSIYRAVIILISFISISFYSFAQDFSRKTEIPFPDAELNNGGTGNMISGIDIDNDGKKEIYLVNNNFHDTPNELVPRVYKLEYNGSEWDVVWQTEAQIPKQNTWPPLSIADLDKDGKMEIIWGVINYLETDNLNPSRILVYESKGDGSDVFGIFDGSNGYRPNSTWTITAFDNVDIRPMRWVIEDIDSDGISEIIFADRKGIYSGDYFFGVCSVDNIPDDGNGTETWTLETSGLNHTLSTDIENKWDLAVIDNNAYFFDENEISKLSWNGNYWSYKALSPLPGGISVVSAQVVDIDKDGTKEIVVGDYYYGQGGNKCIWLLQENSNGLEMTQLFDLSRFCPNRGIIGGNFGDIDQDGYVDFVFGTYGAVPDGAIFLLAYRGGDIRNSENYELSIIDSLYVESGMFSVINISNIDSDNELEVLYTSSLPIGDSPDAVTSPIVILDYNYVDVTKPYTSNHNPAKNANGVAITTNIVVHVCDDYSGVKQSSINMIVNGSTVSPSITGSSSDYTITYDPITDFSLNETVTVSIDAEDNAGNAMSTDSYSFTTVSDQSSPQITHTAARTANANESKIISAELTDNVSIKSATLYYRSGGATSYTSSSMTNSSGNTYEATIPANSVTERGLEYYISVEDNSGNTSTYPRSNPAENPQVTQVISSNLAFASATPAMAYRMISVPFDLDNSSPASVLEDDLGSYDDTKWRLLKYVNGSNVEYGTSGFASFEPGNGFWLITKESVSLDAGAGKSLTTALYDTITLQPGWNQIGTPFAFTVNWSDVWKDANVEDKLVGYYGELNEQSGYDYTCTQLEPWQGYFVNNLSNKTALILFPPKAASGSLAKPAKNILSLYDFKENEWGLQLTAACGNSFDKDNYVGCLEEASDTRDHHDFSEAPFFDKHVSLYFPHADWEVFPGRYTADFRTIDADGKFWDFCITTNHAQAEVTLILADIQNLPDDWEIRLVDKSGNHSIDFRQKEKYTWLPDAGESVRNFRLIVGRAQFVESNNPGVPETPQQFALSQNYPNPFNPDTRIHYTLPEAVRVKFTVFNLIGEKICVLRDGKQSAGYHTISWNGANERGEPVTSGVYWLRMEAGQFTAIRKMVLAR